MNHLIKSQDPAFPWHLHPVQLLELAKELGLNADVIQMEAGLDASRFDDLEYRISWDQYRVIAECLEKEGPEDWSYEFGDRLTLASQGMLSLALMSCSSLREILELIIPYKILVTSLMGLELKETENDLLLIVKPEFTRDPIAQKFIEVFFIILYKAASQIGGFKYLLGHSPENICIFLKGAPPRYEPKLQNIFSQNVEWGSQFDYLRVSKRLADVKLETANPVAAANMFKILKAQLLSLPKTKGVLHELRDLFASGIHNQDECANRMYASVATLKRQLKQAHTSFSNELKIYRIEQGCFFLESTSMAISDIADQLGFHDVASFRRMFKKEVGQAPTEYRMARSSG